MPVFCTQETFVSTGALISPYIIGDFIDQLINAVDMSFIYRYFAVFASINLATLALSYIRGRLYIRLQTRMGYFLNRDYIQKLQHAPLSFTDKHTDMYDLRNRTIGISEQEPTLLADTVAYNLALDKPGLLHTNKELLDKLITSLGLETYFDSLPDRLDTQINESSANISGGEKQKLSILRALLKTPDVIILDEPTSALDSASKLALRTYLNKIKEDKIIIVITHDKEFIDSASDIIIQVPTQ